MLDQNRQGTEAPIERPLTVDDLTAIVGEASRAGRTLRLRGGDTHKHFDNLGAATDTTVELTGLNGVIEYSPVDLTLAVEAGVTLAAIDDLLAENSQRLALDMPLRERATIGGTFAAGLSGPRRLRYGSLKDMVIGSEIVNGRGEVTKSGGMVVKNVSGYELSRLHYGAHGAFGVVSRLNLKVVPAPEARVEVQCHYHDVNACLRAAASVLVSSLDPAAVYAVRAGGGWDLHVQLEGSEHFASAQSERVVSHLDDAEPPESTTVSKLSSCSTPAFDAVIEPLSESGSILGRYSVPASRQAAFLDQLEFDVSDVLADAGSGLIYVRCSATRELLEGLQGMNAPLTILAMPDELKPEVDVFGPVDSAAASVLARLKDEYDPDRIFNPGRFVSFL